MRETVVLVHGIWMNGIEFCRLRRKLTRAGYECHTFKYNVWGKSLAETAVRLHEFAETIDAPIVHFVGHSLGGIILMHLFDQFPFAKEGRIVLLASPVNGSVVAKRLNHTSITRWTLGQGMEQGLGGDVPAWHGWRDIGTISGAFPLGVGLLVGGLDLPLTGFLVGELVVQLQLKSFLGLGRGNQQHLSHLDQAGILDVIDLHNGLYRHPKLLGDLAQGVTCLYSVSDDSRDGCWCGDGGGERRGGDGGGRWDGDSRGGRRDGDGARFPNAQALDSPLKDLLAVSVKVLVGGTTEQIGHAWLGRGDDQLPELCQPACADVYRLCGRHGAELSLVVRDEARAHLFFGGLFDLLILLISQGTCQAGVFYHHDYDLGAASTVTHAPSVDTADVVVPARFETFEGGL